MTTKLLTSAALAAVLAMTAGCNNGGVSTTSPSSPATNTFPFAGTLAAPVGGVGPSASLPFTVGQSGGTVTALLTAAVETYPNGTLNTTVVMGIGIGTPSGSSCTLPAGSVLQFLAAGPSSGIQGTFNPGTYCVVLTSEDLASTAGSVAYTVIVTTP